MDIEYAWLAGIVEGEGCIDLKNRGGITALRLRVKMTDRDVVDRVGKLFGTKVVTLRQPNGWKTQYEAAVTGRKAEAILLEILPLLGERRTQKAKSLLPK